MEENATNTSVPQTSESTTKHSFARVPMDKRQSTASIAFIWAGSVVCIPVLAVGALLITQVSFTTLLIFAVLGFLIQSVLMCLNGIAGSDQGLPVAVLLSKSFGEKGARFVGSLVIALNVTGSFALQTTFCAGAFNAALLSAWGIEVPFWISAIIWGAVMLYTAIRGFGGMKWLNYIAMPLLLVVSIYATITSLSNYGGFSALFAYQPSNPGDLMSVLSLLIGLIAGASVICADITRHAKSRSATVISTATGFFPTAVIFLAFGAIMGLGAGTGDITQVFVGMSLPVIGLVAMILATWTTNVTNGYSAGIALTRMFGFSEDRRWIGTLIAGVIGITVAVAGITVDSLYGFMSTITPPIAGVMVADYWIDGRGKKENWGIREGLNWTGIAAAVCGAVIGFAFPNFLNKAINSIVVAIIMYTIFSTVAKKSLPKIQKID